MPYFPTLDGRRDEMLIRQAVYEVLRGINVAQVTQIVHRADVVEREWRTEGASYSPIPAPGQRYFSVGPSEVGGTHVVGP